jgi:NCAIR mutase (PurE)-related protein
LLLRKYSKKIEKIQGAIVLILAAKDKIALTTPMTNQIISRLKKNKFVFYNERAAVAPINTKQLNNLIS